LKIIALASSPCKAVTVHVRPLGKGEWKTVEAKHVARAVWNAKLPAADDDFEYYVVAELADDSKSAIENQRTKLVWPATAPGMNQTVIISE